jgi:hypothetical protein
MSSKDARQQQVESISKAKNAKESPAANEAVGVLLVASAAGQNANDAGAEASVNSAQAGVSDANGKPASSKKKAGKKPGVIDADALLAAASAPADASTAVAGGAASAAPAAKAVVAVAGGGAAPATPAASATSVAVAGGCAARSFRDAASSKPPVNTQLMELAKLARQGAELLANKESAEKLRNKEDAEKKRKAQQEAEYKKLLADHAAALKQASIALQQKIAEISDHPFSKEDIETWKSLSKNQAAPKESRTAAQGLLAAHATLLREIEGLKKKVADLKANKPLSAQEQVSRQKAAAAAQQKAAAEATAQETAAYRAKFNMKFENFMKSQETKPDGSQNSAHMFRKAVKAAMSSRGASVGKLCSDGFDPAILTCISASSGPELVPLFRMDAGTIHIVQNSKDLFPRYDASKASNDGETLSEENYYSRCVMIAGFKFWQHAKTILTRKNESRSEALTMFQILSNAANFSDVYDFKMRQDYVAQQKKQYRDQKQQENKEAAAVASVKSKPSGSSNVFAVLTDDSCDANEVPCARCGSAAKEVCSVNSDAEKSSGGSGRGSVKTRGANCPIRPAGEERAKKDTTMSPTDEQALSLRTYLAVIAGKFGGLSTAPESFKNDSAAWAHKRSDIMEVLSQCGVNTTNSDSVFQFLKTYGFVEQTESEISRANDRKKSVLRILHKDGNVVQKTSDAAGGAAADATSGADAAGASADADAAVDV